MKIVEAFPRDVRVIENQWIPMPDGCRLAARIWLPADAEFRPVPAIVEYIPYRKRTGTPWRDEPMHRYFAGHGYAAVRIDLRGSGESDGVLLDEYLEQEHDDGVEALRWLASQPWCSGRVGMMGKSWGGFNSLQIAARRPEALRAILSVCSTDDRYADDAHYMGGCLLNENLIWGSVLLTINAQPPDPALVGERWREMWLERLEQAALPLETWLRHPTRDDYWKHGSVCEDFSKIECAVYCVGGWADGYTNAVPRLLAGLECPRKGLVGPWAHVYPHEGVPGPAIGFLQEALRWWDYWLKDIDTGIMDEPMYRAWQPTGGSPQSFDEQEQGRWIAEERWPSSRIESLELAVNAGGLAAQPTAETEVVHRSPLITGLDAGSWCSFGLEGELPVDQSGDDTRSLIFDSDPLRQQLAILGAARVRLVVRVDAPTAFVAVRLNDVAPDGHSSRVSYGLMNLCHRTGHEEPEPLVPGARYAVEVALNDAAHVFAAGHRIRLAISTSYWPIAWPSATLARLTLVTGASRLLLPVRPPRAEDDLLSDLGHPEAATPAASVDLHPDGMQRHIERDGASDEIVHTTRIDVDAEGHPTLSRLEAIDLEVGHGMIERFRIREDDPLSAIGEIEHTTLLRRDAWSTSVNTRIVFSSTADDFLLHARLEAFEGDERVYSRDWDRAIPRRFV